MQIEITRLKSFLIEAGLISKERFEEILKKAEEKKRYIGELLVLEKILSPEELKKIEAYFLGIPYINLEKEKIPYDVLRLIPESIARSHNIVAFRKTENQIEVAMLEPSDLRTIDFLKKTTNFKILPRLTTEASIKAVLKQYHKSLKEEFGEIIKEETGKIETIPEEKREGEEKEEDLHKIAQDLPIVKIVNTLLKHSILQRATDIHIEPTEKEIVVRYRIDGVLRQAMILPKSISSGLVARIKILSNLKLDEHRLPQDGRFKIELEDWKYSIRVSILPVIYGEKIVMRLLPETAKALSLEELGLWGESLEKVHSALKKPVGMILASGPTGCGKTTTLYSMIQILNSPEVNISTIEDPVEYRMIGVNQTQVLPAIGLTFANGLRSLLRQDPDILMVGEIRDNETASLAVNAALTGHLVLSTIHTNSASGAIPRLIDMQVEPFLISSTLNCVLAQRLVRKLTDSKERYFLTSAQLKRLSEIIDLKRMMEILKKEKFVDQNASWEKIPFFKPIPSSEAPDGYKGRVGIFEVLEISPTIKEMIVQKRTAQEIQEQAQKEGMILMVEDGLIKAVLGMTTIEEVFRVIIE
ncbi:MAG: GspE/PulE family protein [Minisyncoccales bacterium]